jgi:hypothetical protein
MLRQINSFVYFNHDHMACLTFFQDIFDRLFSPSYIDDILSMGVLVL